MSLLTEQYPFSFTFYKSDVCDASAMEGIFERHGIDFVCHLAARAGVRPSINDPLVYIHSNIKATTTLMEVSNFKEKGEFFSSMAPYLTSICILIHLHYHHHDYYTTIPLSPTQICNRFKVKNFVYASSSSVYGGSKSALFSEDEAVDHPVSPYAATKKACELMAFTYHHLYNLPTTGLRFFTVFGPRGRPDMAPFKFIDRISRGIQIEQFGDGSSSRDYTYISDIVDGTVRALDRPYPYQVFNLGKGKGTSLRDFIQIVEKNVGKKANIKVCADQPGDVPYTCADVSKAKHLLGYSAKVTFEEGIRRTVDWYEKEFELNIEPETQANGLARASSFTDLQEDLEDASHTKKAKLSPRSQKEKEDRIARCPEMALP